MKILTMDDLVKFCEENHLANFSAKDYGKQLCVQVPATFSLEEETKDSTLYGKVTLFHTGRNRNGSCVTEDAAKKCLSSIAYKPLLADIQEIDGELDFTEHAREIVDGKLHYIERQVGCFMDNSSYMDEEPDENGRRYVYARVAIPREYTEAANIIERKNGTKISAELAINAMSYDSKDKTLMITDTEVLGGTCLGKNPETGKEIEEGMEHAKLEIEDFSIDNTRFSADEKMLGMLKEIAEQISQLTINTFRKEEDSQMNKELFDELLAKYGKVAEDLTFDYANLDDDSLTKAFADAFDGEENTPFQENSEPQDDGGEVEDFAEKNHGERDDASVEEESSEEVVQESEEDQNDHADQESSDESEDSGDSESNDSFTLKYSIESNGNKKEFAVSLQEKICALNALVNDTYGESDNTFYFCDVYEEPSKYVVMHDLWNDRHFRQEYSVKKDVYSLKSDRIQVYAQYLTNDEINQLENMKKNYSSIESELAQFKAEPEKIEILESSDYDQIKNTEEYSALLQMENHFSLNKEDLAKKLDDILLNYAKKNKIEFSAKEVKPEKKRDFFAFARIEGNTSFLDGLLKK